MKTRNIPILAVLACVAMTTSGAPANTWLVRDGRPEACIILPRLYGGATRLAADELADYVEKMTGARLPIDAYDAMNAARLRREGLVQIRLEPRVDPIREVSADGSEDVSVLTVGQGTITLAGNSETAILYGIYQILGDQGVRWFIPGDIGEHVPRQADFGLPRGTTTNRPAFRTREIGLSGSPATHYAPRDFDRLLPEYAMWNLRNRCFFVRSILETHASPPAGNRQREQTGHWLPVILRETDIEKEPERFPLVTRDGVRQRQARSSQICFTDSRNVESVVRHKLADFAGNPGLLTASVSPGDHGGFCECDRCVAANDGRYPPIDPNLVVWKFMNAVIGGIRAELPSKRIAFYSSYGSLNAPPAGFKAAPGILGITANTGVNGKRIDDADDPFATAYMRNIMAHKAAGVELGAREYTMFAGTPQPLALLEQIGIYHDLGYAYYHCESMGRDELRWLVHWVQAQLLWHSDQNPAALLEECCRTLYGEAGDAVLEVLRAVDGRARSLPRLVFGSPGVMQWLMSPELVANGRAILKNASRRVGGVHAARLARFNGSFEMFALQGEAVRACYEAMDDLGDESRQTAIRHLDAFDKHWRDANLDETCSPTILARMDAMRSRLEALPSHPAAPAPRQELESPSTEQKLAALFSLQEVPPKVDNLFYLPAVWKFKPDIARKAVEQQWFAPDLDDSGWRELSTCNFYERQGYEAYDGAYCYRVRFTAPAFPAGKRIMMRIGSLDDEGSIYINGKLAHRRWHLVDQDWKRSFAFDAADHILPGAENVVCIIGNDEYGVGGLWNPCALYSAD